VHGQAQLFRQNSSAFSSVSTFKSSMKGNWVFGYEGEDTSHYPLVVGGIFSADASLNLGTNVSGGTGVTDINDNQITSLALTSSGTYATKPPTTTNGRFAATMPATGAPTGYPQDYVAIMVDANHLLVLSTDSHSSNSLVSGIVYKQQQASYSAASLPSVWVEYESAADYAQVMQGTCDSDGNCTINVADQNVEGTYAHDPTNIAPSFPVTLPPATIAANGRMTYPAGTVGVIFYLYDTVSGGGGIVLETNNPVLGYFKPQGTVPNSLASLAASYYMGNLTQLDPNVGTETGSFIVDGSGNMSGTSDKGGQGNTDYGEPLPGMTIPAPPYPYGIFNLEQDGQTGAICYVIAPVVAGPLVYPTTTPYGTYACIMPKDNAKVMLIQQVGDMSITGTPNNGLLNNPYSLQLSANGGNAPYTFSGSCSSSALTVSASGTISGTPTSTGNITCTVTATDSSLPAPATTTTVVTVPVSAGPDGSNNASFSGYFALAFYGFKDADGSRLFMAGSLHADGSGDITSGFLDVNSEAGSFTVSPITGSYAIGEDYRGIVTLNLTGATFTANTTGGTPAGATPPTLPSTFAVALYSFASGTATGARLVGFDDPVTGVHGQGNLRGQNIGGLTPMSTNYTFVATGADLNDNVLYTGASFGLNASGVVGGVAGKTNAIDMVTASGGVVNTPLSGTLTGSATFTGSTGRLFLTLTPSVSPASPVKFPIHYVAYLTGSTSGNWVNLMSVDSYDSINLFPVMSVVNMDVISSSVVSGSLSATDATLNGNFTTWEKGRIVSPSSTTYFSTVTQDSCDSSGNCALNEGYLYQGSTVNYAATGSLTSVSVSPNGRVTYTDVDGSSVFLYLYNNQSGWGPVGNFFRVSTSLGLMAAGQVNDQKLPTPSFTLPHNFAVGVPGPAQLSMLDVSGTATLSLSSGALGTLSGSVDHAGLGFVSYGDSFGPWTLPTPDSFGFSQAVDDNGNLAAACVFNSTTYIECLPFSLEPSGDTPSVLMLNAE
jgi:hypothetical protein